MNIIATTHGFISNTQKEKIEVALATIDPTMLFVRIREAGNYITGWIEIPGARTERTDWASEKPKYKAAVDLLRRMAGK